MTLLTVVKDVCATVGVQVPSTVFGGIANNRTMQEMVSLASEMAQRIAFDTRDWQGMQVGHTFVGDGVATNFNLPADFKRLLLNSNVWRSTSTQQPMMFIPDVDEWTRRRLAGETDSRGEWRLFGTYMGIHPAMGVGTNAAFIYLNRNCVRLASGGAGDTFMGDGDQFVLDERLLKLGMVWQWKAQKGSPYAEDMGSYSDALANAMGHDAPAPILIDRRPMSHSNRGVAYPWPVPT